jgi:hypothetical protein
MVRTVKAFLPVFKDQAPQHSPRHYANARIINLISGAGLNALGAPGPAGYEASKNAAEAFTASLRWEMKKLWNIHVTAINPTFHETPMVKGVFNDVTKTWKQLSPKVRDEYGQGEWMEAVEKSFVLCICSHNPFVCGCVLPLAYFDSFKTFLAKNVICVVWPARIVSEEVVKCVKSPDPPAQLIVGMDGKFGLAVLRMIPAWARTMLLLASDSASVKPAKMMAP